MHPLIGQTASRTLLDSLLTIAKAYPGHLLPEQLRARASSVSCRFDVRALSYSDVTQFPT